MKISKQDLVLFALYAIAFAYALFSHFVKPLPLAAIAVPTALTLFIVFILHVLNILFRNNLS